MKRYAFLAGFILSGIILYGQAADTLTLDQCYRLAEKNYPLARQTGYLSSSSELRTKNIGKNWLPSMNLNGSASLQSEVTEVNIVLPANFPSLSMPTLSKDWYKLTLDVNQAMYDGNITHYQKKLESYNLQADQLSVRVELYKLKDRINQVYFSIILSRENEDILRITKESLDARLKEVQSAVQNGTMMASSEDAIRVELIQIDQEMSKLKYDRAAAYQMLSELTSTAVPDTTVLILPEVRLPSLAFEDKRLEYQLYEVQQEKTGLLKNMVTTSWNPKLYAYGEAGYGRPGLNMLSNDFTPWWTVGARLTWNFFNWNQNKNEKKIYEIQNQIIGSQKETFDKNLRIEADKDVSDILKLTDLVRQDQEILTLREGITRTAYAQFGNGVITSSEYIARLNEEIQARLSMELHRIQLVQAKLSWLYTMGKL
jgi:outer membrane protein TolC